MTLALTRPRWAGELYTIQEKTKGLAPLESSQSWERRPHLHVEIIAGTLLVVEDTICSPDSSRLLSHSAIARDVLFLEQATPIHRRIACEGSNRDV